MTGMQHGTASGYESRGCRCEECRRAMTEARRLVRLRRRRQVSEGQRDVQHGTWAAYLTDGCRCEVCRAFRRAYNSKRRQLHTSG